MFDRRENLSQIAGDPLGVAGFEQLGEEIDFRLLDEAPHFNQIAWRIAGKRKFWKYDQLCAAFGGTGLVIESKRRALIMRIDGSGAKQIDQARQHRAERTALQAGAARLVARITAASARRLALAPGMAVFAIVKSVAVER